MNSNSKLFQFLEWALLIVLLVVVLLLTEHFGFAEGLKPETRIDKIITILGVFFMGFLVLGMHELGHLLTGLWVGFRFELFVVGPLGIRREEEKVIVYFNKNIAYFGGVAATSPVNDHPENARKFARVLIAGPIASLLFAAICLAGSFWVGKPIGLILYAGGLISIAIALATTIPSRTGFFFTDRKRYQRLTRPGKDQQVELAILRIMGRFATDNSYRWVEQEDIALLISDELPFIQFFGLFNQVCYQLEVNGRVEEETNRSYEELSKTMDKNLVNSFNQEIEKLKERRNIAP